jgi:hypothetical protein
VLALGAIALAVVLGLSAIAPQDAQAISIPNPLDVPGKIIGGIGDAVAGSVSGAFDAIINKLFGGIAAKLTTSLLTWLIAIPNFTGSSVGRLSATTTAMAFGALGAVMTISVVRYWLAGLSLSGSGGFEALEGFTRTIGAALFVVAWPFVFKTVIALANTASYTLMHQAGTTKVLASLLGKALVVSSFPGGLGLFVKILLTIVSALLVVGLVLMKIVMSASLAFLYVAMPIAVILWPIDELAWVARIALRTMTTIALMPLVWAICFAVFAAIGVDAVTFHGGGGLLDQAIIKPLTACALLYAAITIPRQMLRAAMLGVAGPGRGFVARVAAYTASRLISRAVSRHIPETMGGERSSSAPSRTPGGVPTPRANPMAGEARASGSGPRAAAMAGAAAGAGAGAAASAGRGAGGASSTAAMPSSGRSSSANASAGSAESVALPAGSSAAVNELPTAGFDLQKMGPRLQAAEARRAGPAPTTSGQVAGAMKALSDRQRQQVADLAHSRDPQEFMRHMVAQSTHPAYTPEREKAFLTLAAAPSQQLSEGIGAAMPDLAPTAIGGSAAGQPAGVLSGGAGNGGGGDGGRSASPFKTAPPGTSEPPSAPPGPRTGDGAATPPARGNDTPTSPFRE